MAVVYSLANKFGHGLFRQTIKKYAFINIAEFKSHVRENQTDIHNGPLELHKKKLERGELEYDEHQNNVITDLQRVYETLQTYFVPTPTKSIFDIFSSGRKQVIAPKGLYIHGSVGGGKTMLMDLFFDCVEVCKYLAFIYILFLYSYT